MPTIDVMESDDLFWVGQGLSRMEQETIIRKAADQDCWEITTADPRMARRLRAFSQRTDVDLRLSKIDRWTLVATVPASSFSLGLRRALTPAELILRKEAGRRLAALREV